jgi:drug/metabolite transporter (DMT)-like permease
LFCTAAAITYTVSNIALRELARIDCDPMWVVFNKEGLAVLVIGVWMAWEALHGRKTLPAWRDVFWLILVGLLVEVVGNPLLQWALGVVGIAVSIPVSSGASMTGGAILGIYVLGERVSVRSMAAMAMLLVGMVFLGIAADSGNAAATMAPITSLDVLLGVGAACLAGTTYGILGVTTCVFVRRNISPMVVLFWITLMAVVTLGPVSLGRLGVQGILETSGNVWFWMFITGLFNLMGFVLLGFGYARITLVQGNVLNAGQVAMAAVAGVILFGEPLSICLILGAGLTMVGILGGGQSNKAATPESRPEKAAIPAMASGKSRDETRPIVSQQV